MLISLVKNYEQLLKDKRMLFHYCDYLSFTHKKCLSSIFVLTFYFITACDKKVILKRSLYSLSVRANNYPTHPIMSEWRENMRKIDMWPLSEVSKPWFFLSTLCVCVYSINIYFVGAKGLERALQNLQNFILGSYVKKSMSFINVPWDTRSIKKEANRKQ